MNRWIACLLAVLILLHGSALVAMADATTSYKADAPEKLTSADLTGEACLVMDRASGRVLFDKNANKRMYPASTTKIMTLLLALEYGHLNDIVTIPPEADKVPSDSSRTPVFGGEKMPFVDLLYGMMLRSGNDAANAVAVIVGGSLDNFSKMMTARAQELGCKDTNFVNAHGYHDDKHYSTAYDLALIAKQGMRHDTFRMISSAINYTMTITDPYPQYPEREKLRLESSNSMFVSSNAAYYKPMVGIKSGAHSKAGNCFVGAAKKNGINLISVTLKVPSGQRAKMWEDTKRLMEYGFSQYELYSFDQMYSKAPIYASIMGADLNDDSNGMLELTPVPGGTLSGYKIYRLPDEQQQTIEDFKASRLIEYSNDLKAPIRQGDIIGTLKMTSDDGEVLTTTLVASRDVAAAPEVMPLEEMYPFLALINYDPVKVALALLALILLLIIFLRVRVVSRRNRRRKEMYNRRMQARDRYRDYKG
ncbi:D-alanyl-D-alanine carboxypeptidase [Eubacteriales bacterium OttesenSCG-928-N13]|nr:D-alanyl-D-alanine carboxypeptidase [Eubacteriales bacterium OttesenSCG-928-N13]